ncbi:MAG: hypothetical protein ABH812_00275 [bacterium]
MSQNKSNLYFDDCPVCLAQKKADEKGKTLSVKELQDAFRLAKKQGAIVGGLPEEEN